jgi:hypothetical protein
LVEAHQAARIRTKIDVFDWLLRNEDKRVGKNAAGYLVASIRSDYQPPSDFLPSAVIAERAIEQARRDHLDLQRKADAEAQAQRESAREMELRAAWQELADTDREAILTQVKAANPSLSRWKNLLEPLCLAALETRIQEFKNGTRRQENLASAELVD